MSAKLTKTATCEISQTAGSRIFNILAGCVRVAPNVKLTLGAIRF